MSLELSRVYFFFNQWLEINQTRIVYEYILTSRRHDEIFVIKTTFDFFRSALINCINILKLRNYPGTNELVGDSWGWGHLFFSGKHF